MYFVLVALVVGIHLSADVHETDAEHKDARRDDNIKLH